MDPCEVRGVSGERRYVGSSLPNWAGSEQVRHYSFSNDGRQLTLSLKNGDRITQTLTWERTRR